MDATVAPELTERDLRLTRVRRTLVRCRMELAAVQSYHAADLVGAAVKHLDRKDDDRGNRKEYHP